MSRTRSKPTRPPGVCLSEVIDYAHQRKIKIWLGKGDCPTLPPNSQEAQPRAADSVFFGTAVCHPGDPVGVEIWEARSVP